MHKRVRIVKVVFLIIIPALILSCEGDFLPGIRGEGENVTTAVEIEEVEGFNLAIAADVMVSYGSEQAITIDAQANIADNIEFNVYKGIWRISYKHWVRDSRPVTIYITLPYISKIAISASGNVVVQDEFTDLDKVDLAISGSGDISFRGESRDLDTQISGSGDILLEGYTKDLHALISGSGHIDSYGMETKDASVIISGSGDIFVYSTDYLEILISGSGNVYYRGYPTIDSRIIGSGSIIDDN